MAVIDGYTFAVNMTDRGVVPTLRQMQAAASAMKSEMRASFETIQRSEGSLSAYNFKLQESDRMIENYTNMQAKLRKELEDVDKARQKEIQENGHIEDSTERRYDKLSRQIENYQHRINGLRQAQSEARASINQLNSGLERNRQITENVKSVSNAYVNELKAEGRAFATTKAQAEAFKLQQGALTNQYRSEVAETNRLGSQLSTLEHRYSFVKSRVQELKAAHRENTEEYARESARLQVLGEHLDSTNTKMSKQAVSALRVRTSISEMSRAAGSVNDGGITRLSRAMNNLSANATRATSHTRAWAESLRGGFMTATMAVAPLGVAMGKSVQMAASLQQSWVTTSNILRTGAHSASEARAEVGKVAIMQRDASKYSKEYGFSQKQIADQYTELVKRGYSAGQSLGSMRSMLEASRASGDDYADVVKNVSSTLDAFNLRQNKTSGQVVANSKRVTNAMAYAADMTATDFQDMGEAMSYVSASAHQAGQSVETTTAAVGELSNAGIEGTRAGTGLRKTINSLIAPTAAAKEALKKYGMSMDDFKTKSGALKPLPKIMETINKHTKDLGKADRGAFFKAVFGTTGEQSAMVLAQNSKAMAGLVEQEKQAEKHDYVRDLARRNMQSTQMQLKTLEMTIQDIAIAMGNKLLPAINNVVSAFSKWVGSKEGQQTLQQFADAVSGVANVISKHSSTIFSFTGGFVDGMLGVFKWAGKAASAIVDFTAAIFKLPGMHGRADGFAKFIGEATGSIIGLIGVFKLFKTVINGMSAVRQDIKSLFHLDGIDSEKSKLQIENDELQTNIDLWKRHNEVSGGDSSVGSNITSEKAGKNAEKDVDGAVAGSLEKNTAKEAERAGTSGGKWYVRAFRKIIVPGFKGIANIALLAFTGGILDLDTLTGIGKKMIGAIASGASKVKNLWRGIFHPSMNEASQSGTRAGANYARGVENGTKVHKRFSFRDLFKGSSNDAKEEGARTGENFSESVTKSATKGNKRISAREMFKNTPNEAREEGSKTGTSFAQSTTRTASKTGKVSVKPTFANAPREAAEAGGKTGTSFIGRIAQTARSSKVAGIGKFVGTKMGGAATIAFGAVDLFAALGSSSKRNRAQAVGRSLGMTTGGAMGAGMGATLGSVAGPIGTVAGGLLGGALGGTAGRKIGAYFGKLWPQIKKGAVIAGKGILAAIEWPFKEAYKFGRKIGKALGKIFSGVHFGSKSSSKTPRASTAQLKEINRMRAAVRGLTSDYRRLQKVNVSRTFNSIRQALRRLYTEFRRLMRVKMDTYFTRMAKNIKKSRLEKELSNIGKSVRNSIKSWQKLIKPLRNASNAFKNLQKSLKGLTGKRSGLSQVSKDSQNLYRTIRKYPFGKEIASQAKIANNAMSGKHAGFVNTFNSNIRSMERTLRSFRSTFNRDWRGTWHGINKPVSSNMSSARDALVHYLNSMQGKASDFEKAYLKGWKGWIDAVVSSFRNGFSKLPGLASSAMRQIISRLNRGISGVNSVISDFGGDKRLRAISYATGTNGGHPGGHMLVNDSAKPHWKELVKFPNQPWTIFDQRNVLVPNAPAGTKVLNGETTYKVMNKLGVHRYAGGSLSDAEQDRISQEFMDHPVQASKELILKLTNWNSSVPVVADLGKAMAIQFAKSIANVLKDLLGIIKEPVNGDWTPVIKSAARVLHFNIAGWQIAKLLRQIQTESGGNEKIPQQISDKNSAEGHPAQGLLQFIPSTFNTWAIPGHHNILSGFDQLLAAINALNHGGEGGWGNIGNGHGWATGGIANIHGLYEVAEGNLPESIIPLDLNKRPRALEVMNHTLDQMEQDGGGTGNISRTSQNDVQFKRQVVGLLGSIAGLSQQQINAIMSLDTDKNSMDRRSNRMRFYRNYGREQHMADVQRLI